MTRIGKQRLAWALLLSLGWATLLAGTAGAAPADLGLKARLIWGTDEPKPEGKNLQDLEPALREKLRKVFKWKNYFKVSEHPITLARHQPTHVRLSHKCEIEVSYADDATIEVKLFGEGKHTGTVHKSAEALRKGQLAIIAGDDKEKYGDAWFVVISANTP